MKIYSNKKKDLFKNLNQKIISGNEALTRGLYESNVQYLSNYPGTPTSEIGELWQIYSYENPNIFYDLSINETIAFESAVGASWSGVRSAVCFKHLGMNLISDALHTVMYSGLSGKKNTGLIIICGGDPDIISSTNAQDIRLFSFHSKLPILEPSTLQECKDFVQLAFEISEKIQLPVMIYTPTNLNHSSGIVKFGNKISQELNIDNRIFNKNQLKYINAIHWAKNNQIKLNKIISNLENEEIILNSKNIYSIEGTIQDSTINQITLSKNLENVEKIKIGFISSGISWIYTNELCQYLGKDIFRLRFLLTYPINHKIVTKFINNLKPDLIFIIEEQESFLELQIKNILYNNKIQIPIFGKNIFSNIGSLSPNIILNSIILASFNYHILKNFQQYNSLLKKIPIEIIKIQEKLPVREPTFCPGCSHRNVFYALRKAVDYYQKTTGIEAIFGGDIGCYTLSMSKPFETIDWLICMGAGVGISNGVAQLVNPKNQHVIALIGDSTLFHSGIPGIQNMVKNDINCLIIILDNQLSAMTGHQASPSTYNSNIENKYNTNLKNISILNFLKSLGTYPIQIFDGYSINSMKKQFEKMFAQKGLKFVIVSAKCALYNMKYLKKRTNLEKHKTYLHIADYCSKCDECYKILGCTAILKNNDSYFINNDQCYGSNCLSCIEICPNNAIIKTDINPHIQNSQQKEDK